MDKQFGTYAYALCSIVYR